MTWAVTAQGQTAQLPGNSAMINHNGRAHARPGPTASQRRQHLTRRAGIPTETHKERQAADLRIFGSPWKRRKGGDLPLPWNCVRRRRSRRQRLARRGQAIITAAAAAELIQHAADLITVLIRAIH